MFSRMHRASRHIPCETLPVFAAVAAVLLLLFGCSGGAEDPLEGTGRVVEGDQFFRTSMTLLDADPADMRRAPVLCEPEELDVTGMCPDDLDELDTTTTAVSFCADNFVLGEISPVDSSVERVRLGMLGNDSEGRQILFLVDEVDLAAIGENEGTLSTPLTFGPCEFTVGVTLDSTCGEYQCEWQEISENPCGGLVDQSADEVPVTCYEDQEPDPCDPAALTFGAADSLTITELTTVPTDADPEDGEEPEISVLENSVAAGTYDATVRSVYPDGTYAEIQLSGEFRARVAAFPFATTNAEALVCP